LDTCPAGCWQLNDLIGATSMAENRRTIIGAVFFAGGLAFTFHTGNAALPLGLTVATVGGVMLLVEYFRG
jgi:hypothetical protein